MILSNNLLDALPSRLASNINVRHTVMYCWRPGESGFTCYMWRLYVINTATAEMQIYNIYLWKYERLLQNKTERNVCNHHPLKKSPEASWGAVGIFVIQTPRLFASHSQHIHLVSQTTVYELTNWLRLYKAKHTGINLNIVSLDFQSVISSRISTRSLINCNQW